MARGQRTEGGDRRMQRTMAELLADETPVRSAAADNDWVLPINTILGGDPPGLMKVSLRRAGSVRSGGRTARMIPYLDAFKDLRTVRSPDGKPTSMLRFDHPDPATCMVQQQGDVMAMWCDCGITRAARSCPHTLSAMTLHLAETYDGNEKLSAGYSDFIDIVNRWRADPTVGVVLNAVARLGAYALLEKITSCRIADEELSALAQQVAVIAAHAEIQQDETSPRQRYIRRMRN